MEKKNVIFVCAYPTAGHLLNVLSTSMWLHKNQNYSKKQIDIKLLFNPENLTLSFITYIFLQKIISFFPKKIIKYMLTFLKNRTKNRSLSKIKIINRLYIKLEIMLNNLIIQNNNSFYRTIFKKNSFIEKYKNWNIKIEFVKLPLLRKFKILFISFFYTFFLIGTCFKKLIYFDRQKFLNLNYKGIHLGDLVAAYTIRLNAKFAGQLNLSVQLFINLVQSIYIIRYAKSLKISYSERAYIIPTEPWYIHQIWVRTLNKRGVKIIDPHSSHTEFIIRENLDYLQTNWKVDRKKFSHDVSSVAKNYLNEKLYNIKMIDTFLEKDFANDNYNNEVKDIYNNSVKFSKNFLSVVIFPQNFEDALYDDGLDGFDDVFHWIQFSIESCLENNEIKKIYIKLHPNIDEINYPANYYALEKLKNKYKNNPKIIILNKTSSLVALAKNLTFYGLTRCGTVTEEMVYLGQPMIGWINGPWNKKFNFLNKWETVKEYELILKNLSFDT